ncbi:MAG: peptidylprolyl isomerase [Treponema sp.]|jgi:parvulin-like peptidyl-prolyl isomerase|nr:peptidylprolyl isomerase [Treponema sp.]
MALKAKKQPVPGDDSAKSELIRRFRENPAVFIGTVIVLVIVIVAFVFVPAIVPNAGGFEVDYTFGYYDKTPISYRPGNYFALVYEQLSQSNQGAYSGENAAYINFQVWWAAFQSAVVHTGILHEMNKAGYEPSKEKVDREVAQAFQVNGRFDAASYRQLSDSRKIAIWREAQEQIIADVYQRDQYELLRPSGENEFVVEMAAAQRRFEGAAYNLQDYPETELSAYAAQNFALFKSVHFSRITINSGEREARQILASVKDGTLSFEDAARNQSQDAYAERGGDMGVQMAYEMDSVISGEAEREKVLALKKGEISDLISTGESWIFFRAEEDPAALDITDAAQIEKVRSYLLLFERGRVVDYFAGLAEEIRARGVEFDKALEEAGLKKFSFGPLAINYGNLPFFPRLAGVEGFDDSALSNFAVTDSFWRTAFSTPVGTVSEPLELGDQVLILLPLDAEPAESPEENAANIELTFRYFALETWVKDAIQPFFTQNPKLKDQFWETYSRYLMN